MHYRRYKHRIKRFYIPLALNKARNITWVFDTHISFNKFLCYYSCHFAVARALQAPANKLRHIPCWIAGIKDKLLHVGKVKVLFAGNDIFRFDIAEGCPGAVDFCNLCSSCRSEEHTSELQSLCNLVCLLL